MKKIALLLAVLTLTLFAATLVSARSVRGFRLPATARQITEDFHYLGRDARGAQGYAFIHRRDGQAKPPWAGGGKGGGETKCYAFLAKDARWRTTEEYVTDIESDVVGTSIEEWDTRVSFDIFGARDTGYAGVLEADTASPDDLNELYFGAIEDPGVIGVTIVWGYFSGPPHSRELIEWDMILDDVDFDWGDAKLDSTVMDFQNVLTHELGHAAGMGHPDDSCTEETMYRFASEGETKKRDLNPGDITGVQELYR